MSSEVLILGAGIAGLGAGHLLGREKATLYEARERYGGLCDNFSPRPGFRFDHAVHLSFASSPVVRAIFDQTPYKAHRPDAFNYFGGRWLKHPIQNNLYGLPTDFKIRAIAGFVDRAALHAGDPARADSNYSEWLRSKYGRFMAEEFFDRYTRKYWCTEPADMEIGWISNRVYQPKLEEVLHGAMTLETPNTYYASEMRYPLRGGYKSFVEPLAASCEIRLGRRAKLIDSGRRHVEFDDGSKVHYESLISSLPLPELVRLLKDAPSAVRNAASLLQATSLVITSIGFARPDVPKNLWFYIYDDDMLPSRAHSPSIKSPDNVPEGCSSIQFETYFSRNRPLPMSVDLVSEHVIEQVARLGLAEKNEVLFVDSRVIHYGNVIFDRELRNQRAVVRDYLGTLGIQSVGRFGEWDYLWSDQSLLSGLGAATRLLENERQGPRHEADQRRHPLL